MSGTALEDDVLEIRVRSAFKDYFREKAPLRSEKKVRALLKSLRVKCGVDLVSIAVGGRGKRDDWW